MAEQAQSRCRVEVALALAVVGAVFYAQVLVLVTMPVAALHSGLTPSLVGLLLAIPGLVSVIGDLPSAALSDAYGRRSFVVLGGTVMLAGGLTLALAPAWPIAWGIGMVLASTAISLLVAPTLAHLTEVTSDSRHTSVQGVNGAVQAGASILATVVSGLLLQASLSQMAFLSVAGAGAAITMVGIRAFGGRTATEAARVRGLVAQGFSTTLDVIGKPAVMLAGILAFVYGIQFLVIGNGFLPSFAIGLGIPPAFVGVLLGARSLVVLAVSPSFGWISARGGLVRPIIGLIVLGGVGTLLTSVASAAPILLVPSVLLQGLGVAYAAAAANVWIAGATPPAARAVAIATTNLASRASMLLIAPLLGVLAQAEPRAPFIAGSALTLAAAAAMWRLSRYDACRWARSGQDCNLQQGDNRHDRARRSRCDRLAR